jgi:hypothetical protein
MKVGYVGDFLNSELEAINNSTSLQYQVNNGVPNQLTELGFNGVRTLAHTSVTAFYAQDAAANPAADRSAHRVDREQGL